MRVIEILDLGMMKANENSPRKRRWYLYRCHCGTYFARARSKSVKQCKACKNKQKASNRTTHGETGTRLYGIHHSMKNRCLNKNHKDYKDYGERGITVCDRWLKYEDFRDWAYANGYADDLTIDRIDSDDNYEPSNCRWTTRSVQARNTRKIYKSNTTGYRGVCRSGSKKNPFVAQIGINSKLVYLGSFVTAIEAAEAYDKYVLTNELEHTLNFEEIKGD